MSNLSRALHDQFVTFCGHPTMTLRMQQGDVFVIKAKDVLTESNARFLKEKALSILPSGVQVMVIDSQVDISLVRRET